MGPAFHAARSPRLSLRAIPLPTTENRGRQQIRVVFIVPKSDSTQGLSSLTPGRLSDHLPKRIHASVNKALRDAFRSGSRTTAKKRLQQLASRLHHDHPDEAASLREALDEVRTFKDMGLPEWLEQTLSTTNPLENLNSNIRRVTHNVKRWRDGEMGRRRVGAAILEAAKGFRRLRGHKGIPRLLAALVRPPERTTRVDRQQLAA